VHSSRSSEKVASYPHQEILEIIKICHFISEKRIRGQIKHSLDWVSIKNTETNYMWMEPYEPVNITLNGH
jgi:hypothetical protein